jgi:hypothetical protein
MAQGIRLAFTLDVQRDEMKSKRNLLSWQVQQDMEGDCVLRKGVIVLGRGGGLTERDVNDRRGCMQGTGEREKEKRL